MNICESVLDLVGDTPLVRLNNIVEPGMATVLAKMETLNPTGSVKDRIAINMVKRAEEEGLLNSVEALLETALTLRHTKQPVMLHSSISIR